MKSKIILLMFAVSVFTLNVNAQENKKKFAEWPELKSFHMVMAQTFHPSEEGNLKPVRERAGELHEKALALNDSKIPAEMDKPEIKSAMLNLAQNTRQLDFLVKKNASDEEVTKQLTTTHDAFHKIVGLCTHEDGEHKEGSHQKEGKEKEVKDQK
jgi:hypothetical protein